MTDAKGATTTLTALPTGPRGFLAGGEEMGALTRDHDWASTPLGPPEKWPQSLRTAVRLMLNTRHPMLIFWGPELLQFYNDAYRQTMGPERHPSALGQRGQECWAEIWHIIGPQIDLVMAGEGATWHEDQLVPVTRHGRREDVWWTYSYSPIDDVTRVGGVLVVCTDVTQEHVTREALRVSEAHWRGIFQNMQEGVVLCEMVHDAAGHAIDYRFLEVNDAVQRLSGIPPEAIIGQLATVAIPGIEQIWIDTFAGVTSTGQPAHFEYSVASLGRWFEVSAYATGPNTFAALFLNVTERRHAAERQTLLAREVDHRAKNALAVVQAALRLTKAPDVPSYMHAVEGRVAALARAQTLLAEDRWTGADLRALLRGELEPFLNVGSGPHVQLEGPALAIPAGAAQPLAMAVHELATNAVKHGGLSAPSGGVSVTWRLESGAPTPQLHLSWTERNATPLAGPPTRRGFGTRVLDATIRQQLGGSVAKAWPAAGLVCTITLPLRATPAFPDPPM
jgi:two-component sensor histidine kinase